MSMPPSTTKFGNIESLLKYLTKVEIEQGVKYVHYRSFTEYAKSLNELKCGKSYVLTVLLFTNFQQLIAIVYQVHARYKSIARCRYGYQLAFYRSK